MLSFTANHPLQTKEDPEHVPEEPVKVEEPVAELEAAPTVEAEVEVAPVVTSSNVEVCTTSIMVEYERLKSPAMSFQEEPAEDPATTVVGVPPVPKEDAPVPAANGHDYPDEELVEPVEETPEVAVTEVRAAVTG